jgi:hypothetical protein
MLLPSAAAESAAAGAADLLSVTSAMALSKPRNYPQIFLLFSCKERLKIRKTLRRVFRDSSVTRSLFVPTVNVTWFLDEIIKAHSKLYIDNQRTRLPVHVYTHVHNIV